MTAERNIAPGSPEELLGDPHPLLEQLGAPEELAVTSSLADAIAFRRVADLPSLRGFLQSYRAVILQPIELPMIARAYQHAARGEINELVQLDAQLAAEKSIRPFALASCRVGQRQLSKLRPMRDQRVVQRYLAAVTEGRALGWHTLVYGVSLAMFSLPLRQGMQNYAERTVRGFVENAARALRLRESDCLNVIALESAEFPHAIEQVLETSAGLRIG